MPLRHLAFTLILVAAASACGNVARAELITMNVDPAGTTSNQNIFGTVLASGSATWPARANFRDYQFELATTSGSTSFDAFSVQLSASLRNGTVNAGNSLRATLWAGPIVANPLLVDSLLTATTDNSLLNASSFSSVVLSGSSFLAQPITPTPSIFFFRIWAEGNSVTGYQTKMAETLGEFQAVTMSPSSTIDGGIAYDTDNDGFIDNGEGAAYDPISEVPEPSSLMLAALGLAATACLAARRAS